eukprot:GSA25T00016182001.1
MPSQVSLQPAQPPSLNADSTCVNTCNVSVGLNSGPMACGQVQESVGLSLGTSSGERAALNQQQMTFTNQGQTSFFSGGAGGTSSTRVAPNLMATSLGSTPSPPHIFGQNQNLPLSGGATSGCGGLSVVGGSLTGSLLSPVAYDGGRSPTNPLLSSLLNQLPSNVSTARLLAQAFSHSLEHHATTTTSVDNNNSTTSYGADTSSSMQLQGTSSNNFPQKLPQQIQQLQDGNSFLGCNSTFSTQQQNLTPHVQLLASTPIPTVDPRLPPSLPPQLPSTMIPLPAGPAASTDTATAANTLNAKAEETTSSAVVQQLAQQPCATSNQAGNCAGFRDFRAMSVSGSNAGNSITGVCDAAGGNGGCFNISPMLQNT